MALPLSVTLSLPRRRSPLRTVSPASSAFAMRRPVGPRRSLHCRNTVRTDTVGNAVETTTTVENSDSRDTDNNVGGEETQATGLAGEVGRGGDSGGDAGRSPTTDNHPSKAVVELSEYGRTASEKMMEFLTTVTMEVMETYQGAEGTPLKFEPAKHRPINWWRSATHAASALFVVALCQFVLVQQSQRVLAAAFVASMTWIWEIGRRRSHTFDRAMVAVFKAIGMQKIFHPEEWTKVTSWTWYVTSLMVLCMLPYVPAAYAGLVVLGFGDPAAGVVGRRWGSTRVPGAGRKTFEGAIAFVLVGWAASTAVLAGVFGREIGFGGAVLLSAAAALGGCIGELYHVSVWKGIDDNFSVPVLGALAALLVANGAGFISILPRVFS